jgi:Ca2+-binding EF-hand superfamily protein
MKIVVIVFTFLFILIGNAYTQEDAFEKADVNKDGHISRDEYDAAVTSKFNEYDANKDGVIDRHEFNAKKDNNAAIEYEFLDRNKDGKLNMDEFKAGATARFQMYDQNRDGLLSNPEYRQDTGFPILKIYF